jgi:cell division protein FtsQ
LTKSRVKKRKKNTTLKDRIKQRRKFNAQDLLHLAVSASRIAAFSILGLSLILAFTWLWLAFVNLQLLQVESIDVQGNEMVAPSQIISSSGINPGDNILLISLSKVADRIEKLAWVDRVTVKRNFPDQVAVVIYERHPYALINIDGLYYIDFKEGKAVIFSSWQPGWESDLPVITGISASDLRTKMKESFDEIASAIELMRTVESSKILRRDRISEVNIATENGLNIITAESGVNIKFGYGEYREKLDKLAKLMQTIGEDLDGVQYVNLKIPDRVIVKFENRDLVKRFSDEG